MKDARWGRLQFYLLWAVFTSLTPASLVFQVVRRSAVQWMMSGLWVSPFFLFGRATNSTVWCWTVYGVQGRGCELPHWVLVVQDGNDKVFSSGNRQLLVLVEVDLLAFDWSIEFWFCYGCVYKKTGPISFLSLSKKFCFNFICFYWGEQGTNNGDSFFFFLDYFPLSKKNDDSFLGFIKKTSNWKTENIFS